MGSGLSSTFFPLVSVSIEVFGIEDTVGIAVVIVAEVVVGVVVVVVDVVVVVVVVVVVLVVEVSVASFCARCFAFFDVERIAVGALAGVVVVGGLTSGGYANIDGLIFDLKENLGILRLEFSAMMAVGVKARLRKCANGYQYQN